MHPPILKTPVLADRDGVWRDEAACADWAAQLAARPGIRDACIELHGDLGAGKTTFTRHLLRALGVAGRIKSPSYAVVEPHEAPSLRAWHFDFYRFSDPREWEDAGFREVFAGPGLKIVEWPEQAGGLLPVPDLRLLIDTVDDGSRRLKVQACTPRGVTLLPALPVDEARGG